MESHKPQEVSSKVRTETEQGGSNLTAYSLKLTTYNIYVFQKPNRRGTTNRQKVKKI